MGDTSRAEGVSRDTIVGLLVLAVAMLLVLSKCGSQQPAASSSPTPKVVAVRVQPDPHGYIHQVSRERYVVPAPDGSALEVQTRLRESWTAADGWTWARQTGTDPAHFIFAPSTDWQTIRQTTPDPAAIDKALRSKIRASENAAGLSPSTPAEMNELLFDFVYDELASGYRPEGALPEDYRHGLMNVLAGLPGADVAANVPDTEGRTATCITYRNKHARPGMTQLIYFDRDYQFIGYTYTVENTEERGERTITERRSVATIPDEVLSVLGDQREEKQLWKCPDQTAQC